MKTILGFLALLALLSYSKTVPEVKQYAIDQFNKNIRKGGGNFSADETKLLVSSDQSGIFNVYEINIADTTVRQVTQFLLFWINT